MAPADHELERRWDAWLVDRNRVSARVVLVLIVVFYPLFGILDYLVAPEEWLWLLFGSRAVVTACTIGMFFLVGRPVFERRGIALTASYMTLVGLGIAVMVFVMGGHASAYATGLILVMITAGTLFMWPPKVAALFHSVVLASFLLPNLPTFTMERLEAGIINAFFLVTAATIMVASQIFSFRARREQVTGQILLERTTANLESAHAALKELDRQKTHFFSNITHELRTPLTIVLSLLESILSGELGSFDKGQRELLQPMWRNALQLLKLINDILELSKLSDGFLRLRPEPTDLGPLVEGVVEHTRPLAARKGIEVALELEPAALRPDDLHVDAEQLERVLINLLSNALKFTDPGGRVVVSLRSDDAATHLAVRDSGVGIPEDRLAAIFERFSQADGSVTRRYGGTGIGLAFAREVVQLHGGRIDVESVVGEGSTFTVSLQHGSDHFDPRFVDRRRKRREGPEARRGEDREPREWTRQLLEREEYRFLDISMATERRVALRSDDHAKAPEILVVEDNPDVLRLVNAQLSVEHSVFLAQNGRLGLELARRELPDVVVTDYMMPEMDGLALVRELKAQPQTADIPVIMLTARGRVEDRVDARGAGADVYLTKPFSPRELRTAITQLLDKRGRQAGHLMKESVRTLEVISAGLAHQIHNPLAYIKTSLFVIDEQLAKLRRALSAPDGTQASRVAAVERAEARIGRMQEAATVGVERLRQVTELVRRYAREGYPAETTPVVLDELVRDVASLVAPQSAADVRVNLELAAGDARVACIPEELQQVVRGLLQNAIDAVDGEGGEVRVSTSSSDGTLVLRVADDGPGIPRAELQRVFTPFYSTKDPDRGMGVGLSIALQVVRSLGGTIAVESEPGEGARFEVRLPPAEVAAAGGAS